MLAFQFGDRVETCGTAQTSRGVVICPWTVCADDGLICWRIHCEGGLYAGHDALFCESVLRPARESVH